MNNLKAPDCECNLSLQAPKLHQIKNSLSKLLRILVNQIYLMTY